MKNHIGLIIVLSLVVVLLSTGCTRVRSQVSPQDQTPTANPTTTIPPVTRTTSAEPVNQTSELAFSNDCHTSYGDWHTDAIITSSTWQPGLPLTIQSRLTVTDGHLQSLNNAGMKADGFCLLVTAERTFDSTGWLRLPSDERMSTLLAPTGLAIEGGVQGAVTNRFGAYDFRTPVDEFQTQSLTSQDASLQWQAAFNIKTRLPDDLPPGIYRLRLDYGITVKKRNLSLNGESFAARPANQIPPNLPVQSAVYSPPIRASGTYVSGQPVDAGKIQPRIPWTILASYNSNGYAGVVADEDKSRFALSPRNIIPDEVILPLYGGDNKTKVSYSLEPQFPADTIDPRTNIPWDYLNGELAVQIVGPDGKTTDLGTAPLVGKSGQWATTTKSAFTTWKPPVYGYYTVKETGWIKDIWGNRYEGGGTYHFWIAKRMTLATATFQGQAYPAGSKYGRDIAFDPAVPADVQVTAGLYPDSNPTAVRTITYGGKASPVGVFGSAQGMQPLSLDTPGEYYAHILAQYTDQEGHLWVSSMTHAGVVYAADSPIVAHGKKLAVDGKLVDRGNTNLEGFVDTQGVNHLVHINYPYLSGDVLLIASDHQGADKIEPVLTFDLKNTPAAYDPKLQTIGATNLKIKTSNGYSPHLFPEYITDRAYYYAGAPRPGFMSRFLVGENGVRAPYWPTSPNSFGGQVNASNNGDLPGIIYRLIGGVVLRKQGASPAYAGYMSSGFILPPRTNDNRVITAGSEDLLGADGTKARLFLVSTRPGMIYSTGTAFVPVAQIDPILPANVTYTLIYPDGRTVTAQGQGDQFGNFAGKDKWLLDMPGIYHYNVAADWQGYKGYMPGLPKNGGEFYVIEKDKPAGAPVLKLNLPEQSSFSPSGILTITGSSTSSSISYAALTPGAVLAQGSVPVTGGKFTYTFDPAAIAKNIPIYDTVNLVTGKPEIKDVVQLTFFSTETGPDSSVCHSAVRIIIRGTTVLYVY